MSNDKPRHPHQIVGSMLYHIDQMEPSQEQQRMRELIMELEWSLLDLTLKASIKEKHVSI